MATYRERFPLVGLGVCGYGDPALQRTAFNWVRLDLNWKEIEQTKGVYNFAKYIAIVQAYAKVRIRVCFVLGYGNPLYTGSKDETVAPVTDSAIAAYSRFCAAAVKTFREQGNLWEIWNEPNITDFWKPRPSPVSYALLVRAAVDAIRAASPNEWICFGSIATMDGRLFLEDILAAPSIWSRCDVISVHTYRFTQPETITNDLKGFPLPVIVTEAGWSQYWAQKILDKTVPWPQQQADLVVRTIKAWQAAGVKLGFLFNWMDPEFGALAIDGSVRPWLLAVQEALAAGAVREYRRHMCELVPDSAFTDVSALLV